MSSSASGKQARHLYEILERMRRLRRGRSGDPALTTLDTAAGHARGHLRRQLKGEIRMSVEDLFELFDLLGAEPGELFDAARRGTTPLDLWLGEMAREDRRQLRLLRPTGAEAPSDLDAALRRLNERLRLGEHAATAPGPFLAAIAALEEDVGDEAGELRFRTWEALGDSFRISAHYSAAAHCFRRALGLAREKPLAKARILRRACYLATDQCDFEAALCFADEAQAIHLYHFRLPDLGRSWIATGIALMFMGRYQQATLRFKAGLKLVADDLFYCIAAWQSIGLCQAWGRDLAGAKESLGKAQAIYRRMPTGRRQAVGLHSLAAEIALAEGDYLTARVLFERIRAIYSQTGHLLDYAAVSMRLAKTLLLLGNQETLSRVVAETTQLITPLSRYRLATAILAELHRSAAAGKLSAKLLDRLFFEFRKRSRATR